MLRLFRLVALLLVFAPVGASAAPLPKDGTLVEAFDVVAFGTEIPGFFGSGAYIRRFAGPVRFFVADEATKPRRREAEAFLRRLGRETEGLETRIVGTAAEANFVLHVVDRVDYQRVGRRIHRNPFMRVPGACIVRSSYGRSGIGRSEALIVSDAGERLFRRCLSEEVLQGLGFLEDTALLPESVFNGASEAERPTRADRILLETLYDPRLAPGMRPETARPLLPEIVRDARRRTR